MKAEGGMELEMDSKVQGVTACRKLSSFALPRRLHCPASRPLKAHHAPTGRHPYIRTRPFETALPS